MMTKIELARNKEFVITLLDSHKSDAGALYGKIMAAMVAKCYNVLPPIKAQEVKMQNKFN